MKLQSKKLVIGIFSLSVLALPLVSPLLVVADTANSTVEVSVGSVISAFTTSGTVALGALTPDSTGKQSISKDTVTVSTNNSAGFNLTLKDADTNYSLSSGSNNISATSGTPAAPTALANNTWGWRIDTLAGFGNGPTSLISNASPSASTFAAIPANGTPYTINSTATTGISATDVWYSTRVNTSQPSGTYNDVVTYTATTN